MIKSIAKLFLSNRFQDASCYGFKQISTQVFPLQFRASPVLWAEPLKRKRKVDPGLLKAREERKKKRIMKEIRKLEKQEKVLKPVAEFEIPDCLRDENLATRKRKIEVPEEVAEERIVLLKKWTKVKFKESVSDHMIIRSLLKSQEQALTELRLESEELYQAAVKIDENLIPFKYKGPSETPKKDDYPFPDGAYIDVSKKWI